MALRLSIALGTFSERSAQPGKDSRCRAFPLVAWSAYHLPYGSITLAGRWADPLSSDARDEEVAGMIALGGMRCLAYAATPCSAIRARLAVCEPGARGTPSRSMRTRLHLKPGQRGTKQLLAQYGDRLVCVRYRYDAQRRKRFKTVEIIVAERAWDPPAPRLANDTPVAVRLDFAELELRQRVKQAGGKWNPDRKLWQLRYADAVALKLAPRIEDERASDTGCLRQTKRYLHGDAPDASTARCSHPEWDACVSC